MSSVTTTTTTTTTPTTTTSNEPRVAGHNGAASLAVGALVVGDARHDGVAHARAEWVEGVAGGSA